MDTFQIVSEFLRNVSPIAFVTAMVFAIIWANNLTRTTQDLQKAVNKTSEALLKITNEQHETDKRVLVLETNSNHIEDSIKELQSKK